MPRLPAVSAKKLIKVLKKKGLFHDRTKGSHYIFVNLERDISVSIPVHQGKDLGRGLTKKILDDANISIDEFLKLL